MCLKVACCVREWRDVTKKERSFQCRLMEKVLKGSNIALRDNELQHTGKDDERKPSSLLVPIVE